MKINKLVLLLLAFIFFNCPFISLAFPNDSTSREIIPPPLTRQCFTVKIGDVVLNIKPQAAKATVGVTDCAWRGSDDIASWVAAITNATYDKICPQNQVSLGFRFGFRGDFLLGGGYDLYVYCCTLRITYMMTQDWVQCPNMPP